MRGSLKIKAVRLIDILKIAYSLYIGQQSEITHLRFILSFNESQHVQAMSCGSRSLHLLRNLTIFSLFSKYYERTHYGHYGIYLKTNYY